MSETATMLALPRPQTSSEDDSFTALMHVVLDSARSSGSLESSASTAASSSTPSTTSDSTSPSVPSLAASGRSASSSTTSSVASSTTPSPCSSILRSSSSNLTLPSRTGSPGISFAPLPRIEPRKRNSPHPLGVAARSRLLRHRRMLREHGLNPDEVPYPYGPGTGIMGGSNAAVDLPDSAAWGEEIREAQAGVDADEEARAEGVRGGHPRTRALSGPSEEDALVSLGRLVKGAGKSLWRSISMKDVRAKAASEPPPPLPEPVPPSEDKGSPLTTEVHLYETDETLPPSVEVANEQPPKKLSTKSPSPSDATSQRNVTPRTSTEAMRRKHTKRMSQFETLTAEFATTIR
ncbi:hypothetical protein BC628DRAFT_513734 [Trametes gibbosa]|nr:hypothetical protein BC628DRAFT_513734 [Trametes gibbosa]